MGRCVRGVRLGVYGVCLLGLRGCVRVWMHGCVFVRVVGIHAYICKYNEPSVTETRGSTAVPTHPTPKPKTTGSDQIPRLQRPNSRHPPALLPPGGKTGPRRGVLGRDGGGGASVKGGRGHSHSRCLLGINSIGRFFHRPPIPGACHQPAPLYMWVPTTARRGVEPGGRDAAGAEGGGALIDGGACCTCSRWMDAWSTDWFIDRPWTGTEPPPKKATNPPTNTPT